MTSVAGLDVGFSLNKKTSGVATIVGQQIDLGRRFGGADAWEPILARGPFQVIASDGPILPAGGDACSIRAVERLFSWGLFQRRCKPGSSHVRGTGLRLRTAAGEAADGLATAATFDETSASFPRVRRGSIVEAFPDAFLGVCLDDPCYGAMPAPLKRGRKFNWLYHQWLRQKLVTKLDLPEDLREELPTRFARTSNRDERAALVCALTALLVVRGTFSAVGDEAGGWFFLPPWEAWQPWARDAVEAGRDRLKALGAKLCIERGNRPTP